MYTFKLKPLPPSQRQIREQSQRQSLEQSREQSRGQSKGQSQMQQTVPILLEKIVETDSEPNQEIEQKNIFNIDTIKDQIIDTLQNADYERERPAIIPEEEATIIYAIGDLEGKIDLMYSFLIGKNLITLQDSQIKWIGAPNVYVVQLGDQLDYRYDNSPDYGRLYDIDIGLFLFMEFLYIISEGKVISLFGNHELLNIKGYYNFVSDNDKVIQTDKKRFTRDDMLNNIMIQNIMKNRFVFFKIGSCIFSHAGMTNNHLKLLENPSIIPFIQYHNDNVRNNSIFWRQNKKKLRDDDLIDDFKELLEHRADNKEHYMETRKFATTFHIVSHREYNYEALENLKSLTNKLPRNHILVIGHNTTPTDKYIYICRHNNDSIICGDMKGKPKSIDEKNEDLYIQKFDIYPNEEGAIVLTDVNTYYNTSKTGKQYDKIKYVTIIIDRSINEEIKYTLNSNEKTFSIDQNHLLYQLLTECKNMFRKNILHKILEYIPPASGGQKSKTYIYFMTKDNKKVKKKLYTIDGKQKVCDGKSKKKPKYVSIQTYKKKYELKTYKKT